jgi:delta24-sterol reductase
MHRQMRELVSFGNHPAFRALFGWLMPPKISLLKITTPASLQTTYEQVRSSAASSAQRSARGAQRFVFQDMLIPLSTLSESLMCFEHEFNMHPLWLCPHRLYRTPKHQGFLKPADGSVPVGGFEIFVDLGACASAARPARRARVCFTWL